MAEFHKKRSPDEFYIQELADLLQNPRTQRRWDDIITLDPMGMFATRPTQSATTANMSIPELQLGNEMVADGVIVSKEDRSIRCVKVAVDLVWNLPALAKRLKMDEKQMRKALADSTQNPKIEDPSYKAYLPPVGGATVYFIGGQAHLQQSTRVERGNPRKRAVTHLPLSLLLLIFVSDISKLNNPETEVAVRVHDECSGSDTFGTDICTCRPYLVYALLGAVQCAQRGGVGVIIYFRKVTFQTTDRCYCERHANQEAAISCCSLTGERTCAQRSILCHCTPPIRFTARYSCTGTDNFLLLLLPLLSCSAFCFL